MTVGPPAAPGEESSLAVALANTSRTRGRSAIDAIATREELASWLLEHNLVTRKPMISDADVTRFHALRDAIRTLLRSAVDGQRPPAGAVLTVNQASAAAPSALQLDWNTIEPLLQQVASTAGDPLLAAEGKIAADAIDLLTGERAATLLACPACIRFLLKDHSRRRWCSTSCGDRIRAARYYHRHKVGYDDA
jgi:predicted RNA-binding Zn ribbon-like protein